jgi:hypothetical protein
MAIWKQATMARRRALRSISFQLSKAVARGVRSRRAALTTMTNHCHATVHTLCPLHDLLPPSKYSMSTRCDSSTREERCRVEA